MFYAWYAFLVQKHMWIYSFNVKYARTCVCVCVCVCVCARACVYIYIYKEIT